MRVLLTGASGFIGAHTVRALSEAGHAVRALVRPTSDRSGLADLPVEYAVGDLIGSGLATACAGMDAVVHLAGLTRARNEAHFMRVNGEGTALLAEAAANVGVRQFMYVSSIAAHGPAVRDQPRDPSEPARPVSPYGRSKAAGETATLAQAERMVVQVLRPPAVYGPRDNGLLPFFRMARWRVVPVMGRGENCLSLIHVQDLAESIKALLESEPTTTGCFHTTGPGKPQSWREMVEALGQTLQRSVNVLPVPAAGFVGAALVAEAGARLSKKPPILDRGKVIEMRQRAWICDHGALTAATGWEPRCDLASGLRETVAWYRAHGWL